MILDLNNLKHTNDTLGHEEGDKLIVDFADILRNTIGSSGVLFRWGGDEFVVFVRNVNQQKFADYALKIHKAVGFRFQVIFRHFQCRNFWQKLMSLCMRTNNAGMINIHRISYEIKNRLSVLHSGNA